MKKIKAAFFDRDGTLISDVNYLQSIDQIKLIEHAVAITQVCQSLGYHIFVVTNQSGVGRGFFDEAFVQKTHDYLKELFIKKGVTICDFYYCPHHPEAIIQTYRKICECRKPLPGMLLQAAKDYKIDLTASLMFGDKACDVNAGRAAGCLSFDITKLFLQPLDEVAKLIVNGTLI